MKKTSILFLVFCILLSLFLTFFKFDETPKCLNADEAAFGYNAYSILKTGKDEYGNTLPMRLKSFGDYKLPLYSYFSMPFIAIFGLNEFSTRFLAGVLGAFFPVLIYFFSQEIFKKEKVALTAVFLTAASPWLHIFSRQAHEATLAAFFISLTFLFYLKFLKRNSTPDFILMTFFSGLSLFSYHISRLLIIFLFVILIFHFLKNSMKFAKAKRIVLVLIFIVPILIFSYGDVKYNPARLTNLIFYKTAGFSLKINELRAEHDIRLLHNKLTQSLIDLPKEYLKYLSPQYLVITEDDNPRFGMPGVSPVTAIEYIFLIVGICYLFLKKEKNRYFLILLLAVSPLSASLSWQSYSLARGFYLLIPIIIITSFGFISLWQERGNRNKLIAAFSVIILFIFIYYSWDFYFFHYSKRAFVLRSWQCGYKEVTSYIKKNYDRFERIVMTDKHGQPYIFFLYYLGFNPAEYQRQARLSAPDEYGFGQIYKFDKFDFRFQFSEKSSRTLYVGTPSDFENLPIDRGKIQKIIIGSEEIFYLYEI